MEYQYWVIRYVPNVARGEFANIGLVCGADGHDWAAQFDMSGTPAPGVLRPDLRALRAWTRWFSDRIATFPSPSFDGDRVSSAWLEHLRSRQANAVQFSRPAPIEALSAAEAVALLFPHLVERDHNRRPRGRRTRTAMRSTLRDLLQHERAFLPGHTLFMQPRMTVGRQRGGFDIARDEASGTVLTNTWAFNVASLEYLERDIQSWNYLVSRFRSDGGDVELDGQRRRLGGGERVEVVYDPPTQGTEDSWRSDIFGAAEEAWQLGEVVATPYDDYVHKLRGVAVMGG